MKKPKKKNGHGGARENAGRKTTEPTVVMRIKVSKVKKVKKLLAQD